MTFPALLAEYMLAHSLTGRALAVELQVSEATISGWLAGQHEPTGAAREQLVKMGLIDAPEIGVTEQVLAYVRRSPGRTPARIAVDLTVDPGAVHAALRNLRRQRLVAPATATREAWALQLPGDDGV